MTEAQHDYARQECIIQSQLGKHENIVELYDYTETSDEFVLLMEYCNDANYFEEKIESVSHSRVRREKCEEDYSIYLFKADPNHICVQRLTPIKN